MGGGPSSTSQTTTQNLPPWVAPYSKLLLGEFGNMLFPGLQTPNIPNLGIGGKSGNPLPGLPQMPSNLNQSVAGFTPDQLAAMQGVDNTTGAASNLAGAGAANAQSTLGGTYLNPATNPYLTDTFNQGAQGLVSQYQNAIAPSLQAQAQQGGVAGGSAEGQQQLMDQYGLGQSLNNLATDIYGGNYSQERQNQLSTLGMMPGIQSSLYSPYQQQLGVGSLQQQQQQSQLDTGYQNALAANQYPMQRLQALAGILGPAAGNAGSSMTVGPNPAATK